MADTSGAITPAPAEPKKPGYHIDIKIPHDRQAQRGKAVRWLSLGLFSSVAIFAPAGLLGHLASYTNLGDLVGVASATGIVAGGFIEIPLLTRSLAYNPEWTAYVTQDALFGTNIPYGPGLHPTFPWEERNASGNYSLKVITKPFEIMVQTKTAKVKVKGLLQYAVDLSNITRFIGIDATTIESGLTGFLQSFLTGQYADMTAEEARKSVPETNEALCNEFMHVRVDEESEADFEVKYGIVVVTIMLNDLELSAAAQKARDAIDEAEAINRTVAALLKVTPEDLAAKVQSGAISKEQFLEYLNRAMATSDNATLNINVHEINLPNLVDKAIEQLGKIGATLAAHNDNHS
jgi:hypothetical protein